MLTIIKKLLPLLFLALLAGCSKSANDIDEPNTPSPSTPEWKKVDSLGLKVSDKEIHIFEIHESLEPKNYFLVATRNSNPWIGVYDKDGNALFEQNFTEQTSISTNNGEELLLNSLGTTLFAEQDDKVKLVTNYINDQDSITGLIQFKFDFYKESEDVMVSTKEVLTERGDYFIFSIIPWYENSFALGYTDYQDSLPDGKQKLEIVDTDDTIIADFNDGTTPVYNVPTTISTPLNYEEFLNTTNLYIEKLLIGQPGSVWKYNFEVPENTNIERIVIRSLINGKVTLDLYRSGGTPRLESIQLDLADGTRI